MALVDLIAQSGAKNFEKIRKGWLPTTQEKAARKIAQLNIKAKQQAVDYEPERQKMAREKGKLDIQVQKNLIKRHETDTENFTSKRDKDKRDLEIKNRGRLLREAAQLDSVDKQKELLSTNADSMFPEGSDPAKKEGFLNMMDLQGKDFTKQFRSVRQGNTFLQGLNDKLFGETETYFNPETGEVDQVSKDSPDYFDEVRDLKKRGLIVSKKMGIDLTGNVDKLTTAKGKTLIKSLDKQTEQKAHLSNSIAGYGEMIKFIASDNFKPSIVGDAVMIANDIVRQGKAIFGNASALNDDGSIDFNKIEKGSGVLAELRKMANVGGRYKSLLIEMAYMKAKADNRGKVSDADFQFAKQMLDNSADKSVMINTLKDNIYRLEGNYNRSSEVYNNSYNTKKFESINADKILGWGEFSSENMENTANAEFQKRKAVYDARLKAYNESMKQ